MFIKYSFLFILLFLLSGISIANAQNQFINDTSSVEVRQPPAEKIDSYSESKDFQYGTIQEPESVWQKIQIWVWKQVEKLLYNKVTQNILEIVFYLVIGFIIFLLIKQYTSGGIFRFQNAQPADFSVGKISDTPTDLEPEIQRAIKAQQFNLAISLLYKKSLIQLQNKGWINWQKNKTNHDYIYEIKRNELRETFRDATRYYEYAQYGNFQIGKTSFEKAQSQFKRMDSIIGASST